MNIFGLCLSFFRTDAEVERVEDELWDAVKNHDVNLVNTFKVKDNNNRRIKDYI